MYVRFFFSLLVWLVAIPVFADDDRRHFPTVQIPSEVVEQINHSYRRDIKPFFQAKCFDCHVTDPDYPWYVAVPGLGAVMRKHNREGVEDLDLSNDFPFKGDGNISEVLEEIGEEVLQEREMPPTYYLVTHWDASLTDAERGRLIAWLRQTQRLLAAR